MASEVMECRICGNLWLIHVAYLTHPYAVHCRHCGNDAGCITEALQPQDTQPGAHAELEALTS